MRFIHSHGLENGNLNIFFLLGTILIYEVINEVVLVFIKSKMQRYLLYIYETCIQCYKWYKLTNLIRIMLSLKSVKNNIPFSVDVHNKSDIIVTKNAMIYNPSSFTPIHWLNGKNKKK